MRTDDLDFHLPPELIAQQPSEKRDASCLLHYRRADQTIAHRRFGELPSLVGSKDLLVFNNARVISARFTLAKATGGLVDGLFLEQRDDGAWIALLKNVGPLRDALTLSLADDPTVCLQVIGRQAEAYILRVDSSESPHELLARVGRMPLPPYIRRERRRDTRDAGDAERYQTVFASATGSVAAPTAGLHFTPEVFAELDRRGVERAMVTLHVGAGTFKPVTAEHLADHAMHSERYEIAPEAAKQINAAKAAGRRIVAVGTTSARVLESQPANQPIAAGERETSILIYPPYRWGHVGALLTNFHLPRSTLVALVAALVGLDEQQRIYREAIEQQYRFFSYGDAMFIE